jgi:hypothetical protein
MADDLKQPIYALNWFDVADREEYLAYARRSAAEVERHGGRAHFDAYRSDPDLADLHPHREAGGGNYVWHLFDKLDDLRPLLKEAEG